MFRACKIGFIGVLLAIVPVEKSVLWAADDTASTPPKGAADSTPPKGAADSTPPKGAADSTLPKGAADSTLPKDAADSTLPKSSGSTYTGKVVVVDRTARTVTVEIEKRLYLLKLSPNAKIVRKGRRISIAEVLTGQEVTVQLVEAAEGEVLVAKLNIEPPKAGAEPAEPAGNGADPATPATPGVNPATPATPYNGSPNRPPVSPYN